MAIVIVLNGSWGIMRTHLTTSTDTPPAEKRSAQCLGGSRLSGTFRLTHGDRRTRGVIAYARRVTRPEEGGGEDAERALLGSGGNGILIPRYVNKSSMAFR